MSDMDSDDRQLLIGCGTFLVFALIICSTILGGCRACEETNREAIKAGLVQSRGTGGNGWMIWVKPEEKDK